MSAFLCLLAVRSLSCEHDYIIPQISNIVKGKMKEFTAEGAEDAGVICRKEAQKAQNDSEGERTYPSPT